MTPDSRRDYWVHDQQGPEEPCRAHGDAGLLTLVVDPTPGLQLFDPCGAKWLDCADLAPLEQVLRNILPSMDLANRSRRANRRRACRSTRC